MEHEIVESWFASAINGNNLAIKDGVAGRCAAICCAKSANDPNEFPFRDTSWGRRSITVTLPGWGMDFWDILLAVLTALLIWSGLKGI
jgi:hypothetical protein